MKRLSLLTAALLLATATAYGKSAYDSSKEKVKFGIHYRPAIFSGKIGAFGEYKFTKAFGVQAALLYFWDHYSMINLKEGGGAMLVNPKNVSLPVILRIYPGEGRQFCLFFGLQTNKLVGGKCLYINGEDANNEQALGEFMKNVFKKEKWDNLKDNHQDNDKLSTWGIHLVWGFDYEFLGGFQLGLEVGKGLSSLLECEKTFLNGTFQFALGYNFGKLID